MNPWDVLVDVLEDMPELADVNVYGTPTEDVQAPAIVIRPDTPWISPQDSMYPADTEHYVAIAVATASSPEDSVAVLHTMAHAIANGARVAGWEFVEAGGPAIDETISPFLTVPVLLIYRQCEPEES